MTPPTGWRLLWPAPRAGVLGLVVICLLAVPLAAPSGATTATLSRQDVATHAPQHPPAHRQAYHGSKAWRSGVFSGFSAQDDRAFGAWRGRPITSATDFQFAASWLSFDTAFRVVHTWAGNAKGLLLSISVPLWAGFGDHFAAAAAGYYNRHFQAMARSLVAAGLGHSVLRIGWEFNGHWFNWGVTRSGHPNQYARDARYFAAAWRQVVRARRSVRGAHFRFDWCVAAGPHYRHVAKAYPGDRYVDFIGEDVYDWNRRGYAHTPRARWRAIVHQGTGLAWLAKFASKHDKPISIPEWALTSATFEKERAGKDDPYFIRKMHHWIAHHDVAYENYFNFADGFSASYSLDGQSTKFPVAGQVYRTLWGRRGGVHRRTT